MMHISATLLSVCLVTSLSVPSLQVPAIQFKGRVASVHGGDAVKLITSGGEYLVALYGVCCDDLDKQAQEKSKNFILEQTNDVEVTVKSVMTIEGLSYVELSLPSGELLNTELLSQGLCGIDSQFEPAPEYLKAIGPGKSSDKNSMKVIIEQNSPKQTVEDSHKALQEYKEFNKLFDIAQFEAEVEKWKSLPDTYRASIRRYYSRLYSGSRRGYSELLAQKNANTQSATQSLEDNSGRIAGKQLAITRENLSEDFSKSVIYSDPELRWNSQLAGSHAKDAIAEAATGQEHSAEISATLMNEYMFKAMMDLDRVNGAAATVSETYNARRRAHQEDVRQLQEERYKIIAQQRRSINEEGTAATIAADDERMLSDKISRLNLLDLVATQDFLPSIEAKQIYRIHGTQDIDRYPFTVKSRLWRIDWYSRGGSPANTLKIDVFKVGAKLPIARLSSDCPPQEAFKILEKNGEYALKISDSSSQEYVIDIFELQLPQQ
ncbi:MAG: hypothetical protein K1Y02_20260 [Candidatus Hydrogenedentes bacterium]|nr:hypothetical protein [Candidatus Hydrogenedentota bacterium]